MNAEGVRSSPTVPLRCRPPENLAGSSVEETLARHQQAIVELAQCLDDELAIRPASSLLSFLFFKVIVPFVAISAAISTFYSGLLRAAKPHFAYTEHGLAALHLLLALAVLALWLECRKHGDATRFSRYDRSLQRRFGVAVPPGKESISRNPMVNRWIFISLVVGIVFVMPALFYLLRANALEHLGSRFIIDTTGICRPTVGGYNPFEGSDTCTGGGIDYVERPIITGANAALGGGAMGAPIGDAPARLDRAAIDSAEVRLDGTTTLAIFFVILVGGLLINMFRWWRQHRTRLPASGS